MNQPTPQTAAGKVLWHCTMSLDGFVSGSAHDMGWLDGLWHRPGLVDEYAATTGAVLAGRAGWDVVREGWDHGHKPYGGAWTARSSSSPIAPRTPGLPRA